jgi:hypothetical protein
MLTCHQDTEIAPKDLRLQQHSDLTIHWKALKEHFLMVPLDLGFTYFQGENKCIF